MSLLTSLAYRTYSHTVAPLVHKAFAIDLVMRTANQQQNRWLGQPILQNPLDLLTIQDTIFEVQPALIIETGTLKGGSALFYGHLFDLMETEGRVVTVDLKSLVTRTHPRVTYLHGSSVDPDVLRDVSAQVEAVRGPVMVILDSLHTADHVRQELDAYSRFVTRGSYLLVQDGLVDTLPVFRSQRPGPLPAIRHFLGEHPEFEADLERSRRFVITDHPMGWLRRL